MTSNNMKQYTSIRYCFVMMFIKFLHQSIGQYSTSTRSNILSITLPKLSPTFTSGKLVNLYITNNQYVVPNDLLYDIETNNLTESNTKQIIQIECHEDGTICNINKSINDTVYVDDIIAELQLDEDEDATGKQFAYQAYTK